MQQPVATDRIRVGSVQRRGLELSCADSCARISQRQRDGIRGRGFCSRCCCSCLRSDTMPASNLVPVLARVFSQSGPGACNTRSHNRRPRGPRESGAGIHEFLLLWRLLPRRGIALVRIVVALVTRRFSTRSQCEYGCDLAHRSLQLALVADIEPHARRPRCTVCAHTALRQHCTTQQTRQHRRWRRQPCAVASPAQESRCCPPSLTAYPV